MRLFQKLIYRSFANKLDFHILETMWNLWFWGGIKDFKAPYVEIEGRVFSNKFQNVQAGIEKAKEFSLAEYQKYTSHVHMSMFVDAWFWDCGDSPEDYAFAAEFYEALLAHSLKKRFPEKEFVIERQTEEDGDITVTFYQPEEST